MNSNLLKFLVLLILTVFAIMALIYILDNGGIIQNKDLFYPLKSGSEIEEKSIEELIEIKGNNESKNDTYVFVLDVSQSIKWKWKERFPKWYFNTIDELKDRISAREFDIYNYRNSVFDLCKVNLFQNLLEIEGRGLNFAVYKLGDEAEIVYPPKISMEMYAKSKTHNILSAIEIIHKEIGNRKELNTDFKDLFTKVLKNHLKAYEKNPKVGNFEVDFPTFGLVIISDLLHDVENKIKRRYGKIGLKDRIEENRKKLIERINEVIDSGLLIDTIVLKEATYLKSREQETFIWEYLKDSTDKYKPQIISLKDYYNKCLLRAIKKDNNIDFNYIEGVRKVKSSFRIKLKEAGNYKFGLDVPNGKISTKGDLKYNILDAQNNSLQSNYKSRFLLVDGKVTDHFSLVELKLKGYEKIQLDYSGEVPSEAKEESFLEFKCPFGKRA